MNTRNKKIGKFEPATADDVYPELIPLPEKPDVGETEFITPEWSIKNDERK